MFQFLIELLMFYYVADALNNNLQVLEQPDVVQGCLDNIFETYFRARDLIMVFDLDETFIDFNWRSSAIMFYNDYTRIKHFGIFRKIDVYLIAAKEEDLESLLQFLLKRNSWNARGRFVIILKKYNSKSLFQTLLKYFVVNVIVLVQTSDVNMEISTYFPLFHENNFDETLLGVCNETGPTKENNLFPQKLPQSWTNITLAVVLVKYIPYVACHDCRRQGIEIFVLELLQEWLGFQIKYHNITYNYWGQLNSNGTFTDAYGILQTNQADIGIGFFRAKCPEYFNFDFSSVYMEDKLKWVVPFGVTESHLESLVSIFDDPVWLFLGATLLVTACTLYAIARRKEIDPNLYRNFWVCLSLCLASLLTQTIKSRPFSQTGRFVFTIWCLFGVVIFTAFQSHLATSLNFFQIDNPMGSVQEMIDSGLEFGFLPEFAALFANSTSREERYIHEHYKLCNESYSCMNRTAFQKDFATISSVRHATTAGYYGSRLDGSFAIHLLRQSIQHVHISMVFRKGHPIYEKVNHYLLKIKSAGFMEFAYHQVQHVSSLGASVITSTTLNSDHLSVDELQGAFLLLLVGLLIALLVFVVERFHRSF